MAGTGNSPIGAGGPKRKRPFPFGLVMLAFGLGLGFYGGVSATKQAMVSPVWVQKIFGVSMPVPTAPSAPAVVLTPSPPRSDPPTAPAPPSDTNVSPANPKPADSSEASEKNEPKQAADSKNLLGTWTVTDSLSKDGAPTSSMTSAYGFRSDNTGEYDANGTKLYDFHWTAAGDEISVDFDGEGPDAGQPWNAKLKWSLNGDKSVLTLVPSTGKDPRSFVYSLGPGVYHHKGK